jgi:CheY-like chemotaxis protein
VVGCDSAFAAFEVLISDQTLDAAVFDISMPDEDGLTLMGRLRDLETDRPGHLPVVALTAHVTSEMERRCHDAGFDHYLSKPVSPAELFNVLRRLAHLH